MSLNFEKYTAKGNEFVRLVADELDVSRDKAGRIIRAVLHSLRNRLSHEESFQLMAQLPMVLKGIYVDGWHFDKDFTRISHLKNFLEEVRQEDGGLAGYDFGNDAKAGVAVASVFKAMTYFVSEGEMKDIIDVMPAELKEFIKKNIAGNETVL
ncbi:MAG: DUF2267 domain-containing protein [Chitinophagaceae bacterium]